MEEQKIKNKKESSNNKNKNKTKLYLLTLEKRANNKIYQHYKKIGTTYNYLILDNLLSNGKCHIVALFKEYLIVDDNSEFLRRFYNKKESLPRIKKVSNYYHETSVIFPNYTPLIEAKYIYKNIMRKQKVIDQIQELEDKEREKNHKVKKRKEKEKDLNENVFSDTAYGEILNQSESVLRIVFGINKNKYKLNNDEEVDNEYKGIENLIDEISKYEIQTQIQNNIINKNKLKLRIPSSKKKLSIPNIKTIMDYKNKPNPFNTINFRTFSPNSTNFNTINNSTSRNLKVNITLLNNNSINSNRQINHKSTFSMPKINISPTKDKKIKLLSFNSIENNNNNNNNKNNNKNNNNVNKINIKNIEMKAFFMSNIASPSINKKMHKKIRSVLGRNNENELFKTYYKNFNTSGNIEKEKKKLLLKPSELTGRKVKPSLFLQEEFCGFYTDRNKK